MGAWRDTKATAQLMVCVDADDPELDTYKALGVSHDPKIIVSWGARQKICQIINSAANAHAHQYDHIGFMGDDHLPRTERWDAELSEEIIRMGGTGVAYGNDLLMSEKMPTAVLLSADIIRSLGYMAPPTLEHLCLDLVWKDWGEGLERISYRDDVVIEHMHPANGKSDLDDLYRENNSPEQTTRDADAYYAYRDGPVDDRKPSLEGDLDELRKLLGAE